MHSWGGRYTFRSRDVITRLFSLNQHFFSTHRNRLQDTATILFFFFLRDKKWQSYTLNVIRVEPACILNEGVFPIILFLSCLSHIYLKFSNTMQHQSGSNFQLSGTRIWNQQFQVCSHILPHKPFELELCVWEKSYLWFPVETQLSGFADPLVQFAGHALTVCCVLLTKPTNSRN